ncbi:hypothetical protein F443_07443 [Phytophthora nicotianae P1569]|uniref:SWIM-type domain-containing protein n=1 Tax=Phytophthora nicotianae P1569 TaxID=1317065 RepID=V9FBM8_PHYNI|nr:hypothetical protein F443_07443 [Phytophthora nicotianae P1569]
MVDKDLNEIRVLETNFPGARILVCHFHVIKYMKEMRAKPEFGKISSEDASQIDGAVHKMIYAACEELYKASRDALQGICARIGLNGFYEYFLKNWDSCQDRWVYYLRSKLPHFRNHTNNRLESFFGKLKDVVDGSMSMAACVKALVANDRRVENEYKYRLSRIGRFTNSGYDEEMSTVLRFTTHYVAGQIEQQYATALSKADSYNYVEDQENSGVVVVNGVFSEHKLSLADWRCDCEFSMSMKLPCRHAIAYRKHCNASGPLIPWSGIDERWTTTAQALKKVKQFSYEKFDDEGEGGPKKKLRTQSERYREAVRATHLIANEMAEIEDEDEFESMLKFVLDQWRNVRQRKRVAVRQQVGVASSCVDEDEHCEAKFTDAQVKTEFDISSSEQEVPSGSSEEESSMDTESSVSRDKFQKKQVTICLNPKAKKVGRPQKKKKATSAGEKKDRKWYEAIEEGRKTAGEVTLSALLNSLDREQPGLVETERRLSGVLVKYEEAEKKKPKYKVLKNPVLILDPFFVLPSKLLSACIKVLPASNTQDTAISIDDSQSSKGPRQQRASGKEGVETVLIKDVGSFSRDQIEIFKRVQNMKAAVHSGIDMHRWLVDKGIASLPGGYHGFANQVADEVMATYPYKKIQGLPNLTDYAYVMLYIVSPPEWLTDAAIRAVCWRLTEDYPTCRFAGFQSASPKQNRTRNKENDLVDVSIRTAVQQYIRDDSVQTVMLPLNFDNFHWCCVVIKVTEKRIDFYDPLNQTAYVNACSDIATTMKITGLQDYNVISQNNPLQFDGFSCGVYVCWMFIHNVIPGLHVDMIDTSLTRRRVELFFYLLKGLLLPLEGNTAVASNPDDEEEKMKAPSSEEKPGSDEEVPSTQIAQ